MGMVNLIARFFFYGSNQALQHARYGSQICAYEIDIITGSNCSQLGYFQLSIELAGRPQCYI